MEFRYISRLAVLLAIGIGLGAGASRTLRSSSWRRS